MNPMLIVLLYAIAVACTAKFIQWISDDEYVNDLVSMITSLALMGAAIAWLFTALLWSGSYVSVKLWNQSHGTNWTATQWFWSEQQLKEYKQ